jgi:xanthine dehydrogenase accessory factor
MSWLAEIAEEVAEHGAAVRVTVVRADGSTPREVGAAMRVTTQAVCGTIGGGALELAAIAHARALLRDGVRPLASNVETLHDGVREGSDPVAPWRRDVRDFPLGPSLGQCCGGFVRLLFEAFTLRERDHLLAIADLSDGLALRPLNSGAPLQAAAHRKEHRAEWPLPVARVVREMLSGARPRAPALVRVGKGEPGWLVEPVSRGSHPLYIYGAGHVGRALVRALEDLPFAVTWVDTSPARFPETVPPHAKAEVAADPAAFAQRTEADAVHIVLTYSHALDLVICLSLLKRGDFRFLGLIGSATKRARFVKRLSELGIAEGQLARLVCPIGLPGIGGKEPAMIALSVAAQLAQLASEPRRVIGPTPAFRHRQPFPET